MKKIFGIMLIALLALTFIGCKSTPDPEPTNQNISGGDYPEWFITPPYSDDVIYGVGVAKLSDISSSRSTAGARASADIAKQVSVFVESMLTDYFQEAGVDGDSQAISMVESITKEIADANLANARIVESYVADDGTFYILKSYPLNQFIENDVAEAFMRNESAAFAEFKSDEMLNRLDQELSDSEGFQSQTYGGY